MLGDVSWQSGVHSQTFVTIIFFQNFFETFLFRNFEITKQYKQELSWIFYQKIQEILTNFVPVYIYNFF